MIKQERGIIMSLCMHFTDQVYVPFSHQLYLILTQRVIFKFIRKSFQQIHFKIIFGFVIPVFRFYEKSQISNPALTPKANAYRATLLTIWLLRYIVTVNQVTKQPNFSSYRKY